ncbi:MAG TPA: flagellar biosynthesis anti-sigma factor FlgM [Tepidisphaeraceae bacterium]|jgi:anti-sigma28 factor (negative regulator of flagellin synthesis)
MSSINNIGANNPIHRVTGKTVHQPAPAPTSAPTKGTDRVELGNVQGYLSQLKTNDIRVDKVEQIKAAIASGAYETDDKLNATVDKLLDEVL